MQSTGKSDIESPTKSPAFRKYFVADAGLRVLLFVATLTSVVVMVTSKQTKLVPVPGMHILVPLPAKFSHSPAFIYLVAALGVACLYSVITTIASVSAISNPVCASTTKLLFHLALLDTIMLGLVASATGTAGGVGYVGLKGNPHVKWGEICDMYDKFCVHVATSVGVSLSASLLLVILISLHFLHLQARPLNMH